ncbi:MAG: branched chain amino acid aminotransferase, partial [Actinomycetes bacterium]
MTELFEIEINHKPTGHVVREAMLADPGFGRYFTDHMSVVKWTTERGWHDAALVPYAPLAIDPAT